MMHYNLTLDVDKYYANAQHLIVKINDQICSEFKGDDARLILGIITGGIQPEDMTKDMLSRVDDLYHAARKIVEQQKKNVRCCYGS